MAIWQGFGLCYTPQNPWLDYRRKIYEGLYNHIRFLSIGNPKYAGFGRAVKK
jgi:hypothetical protein